MSQTTLVQTIPAKAAALPPKASKVSPNRPWKPYLELTRFSKPAGLLGFYFPYFIGFIFSLNTLPSGSLPPAASLAKLTAVFLLDGLLLRSFGCAWNDTIDQDLDRQVERCKKRPLARGALTTRAAVATTLLLAGARHVLLLATLPLRATHHALLVSALAFVYPFMKRLCDYPQLCLGTAVGWAVFLVDAAAAAATVEGPSPQSDAARRSKAVVALFAGQTLFNVTYDTVYAFQDLRDDLKAGVRSLAVRVRHGAKGFLFALVGTMAAFLLAAAVLAGLLRGPFVAGAALAEAGAVVMLARLDLEDPRSCRDFFVWGQWVVSGALVLGLAGELLLANL